MFHSIGFQPLIVVGGPVNKTITKLLHFNIVWSQHIYAPLTQMTFQMV